MAGDPQHGGARPSWSHVEAGSGRVGVVWRDLFDGRRTCRGGASTTLGAGRVRLPRPPRRACARRDAPRDGRAPPCCGEGQKCGVVVFCEERRPVVIAEPGDVRRPRHGGARTSCPHAEAGSGRVGVVWCVQLDGRRTCRGRASTTLVVGRAPRDGRAPPCWGRTGIVRVGVRRLDEVPGT